MPVVLKMQIDNSLTQGAAIATHNAYCGTLKKKKTILQDFFLHDSHVINFDGIDKNVKAY